MSVPSGVSALADHVFARSVTSVELPDTVEHIGASASKVQPCWHVMVRDARTGDDALPPRCVNARLQHRARRHCRTVCLISGRELFVSSCPQFTEVSIGSGVRVGQLVSPSPPAQVKAITAKADNASTSVDGVLFTKGRDTLLTYLLDVTASPTWFPTARECFALESFEGTL